MTAERDNLDPAEAFVPPTHEQGPVENEAPFKAEVPKRSNMRLLIVGAITAACLVGVIMIGSQVIKSYRISVLEKRAEREKNDRNKQTQIRAPREFVPEVLAPAPVPTEEAPKPPPVPFGMTSATPLPAGQPPLPGSFPVPSGQAGQVPPAASPPPPPPSMMVSSSLGMSQGSAAAKAESMIAALKPAQAQGHQTVQAMASAQASGKPPTTTAQAVAASLGDRSFVLARGSWIPCVLETQLNSSVPGNTSCVIPEDVYSDDGKALLVEKGSRGQGSFGSTLKVGDQRIAVTWNRIKTTKGIVIDVESPATDGVGTSGVGGYVDNHWLDRIGAAVLLSFIEDGLAYAVASKQDSGNQQQGGANIYLPTNSVQSTKRLSEKILDSTINIPPTLYKNRGDRIMIYVNRDLWFDSSYRLVTSK